MVGLKIAIQRKPDFMETRKYSTGTKGRLKMQSDKCKELIRAHSPNLSLATEFIVSIDPDHEDNIWQRFQVPEDVLPELEAWLNGGTTPPVPKPAAPNIPAILQRSLKPASKLPTPNLEAAIQVVSRWLSSEVGRVEIQNLTALEAAEKTLEKFRAQAQS